VIISSRFVQVFDSFRFDVCQGNEISNLWLIFSNIFCIISTRSDVYSEIW
jgi:hypothetical protein